MPVGLQKQQSLFACSSSGWAADLASCETALAWSLRVQSHMGAQPHGLEEEAQPQQACHRAQCQQQQQVGWCRVLGRRKAGHSKRPQSAWGGGCPWAQITMCQGLLIFTSNWAGEPAPSLFPVCGTPTSSLQPMRHNTQNWVPIIQWEECHFSRRASCQVLVQK